jgi:hypothetical protein
MGFYVQGKKLLYAILLLPFFLTAGSGLCFALGVDWDSNMITAIGVGSAPEYAIKPGQANALARRAAVVDAYRNLASIVYGVEVENHTTVEQLTVKKDTIKTAVAGVIRNARIVDEEQLDDGNYQITLSMPIFGQNSLAAAVWQKDTNINTNAAPAPVGTVPATTVPTAGTAAASTNPTAAVLPSGPLPSGTFSGLVVDCRGLGLERAMAPNILDTSSRVIYSSKNVLDQNMIRHGIVSYAESPTEKSILSVVGTNPLVIKGVALTDFHRNPVISKEDGDKILNAIQKNDFLGSCSVVLIK